MLKHNIWDVEHEKIILLVDKFIFINLILWKFGISKQNLKKSKSSKKSDKLAPLKHKKVSLLIIQENLVQFHLGNCFLLKKKRK